MTTPPARPDPIGPEKSPRPASRQEDGQPPASADGNRFLLTRSTDSPPRSRVSLGKLLQFKIKHIMYLSVITAVLMAIRDPLVESFPLLVKSIVWVSGGLAVALTVGVYGIALMMEEGTQKDKLARSILYFLTVDMLFFVVFFLVDERH